MVDDQGRSNQALRHWTANVLGMFLVLACSGSAGAQETCGLSFISGPSGSIHDPSIDVGTPVGGNFAVLSADLSGPGSRDLIIGIGSGPPDKQSLPIRILRQNPTGTGLLDVTRALLGEGALPTLEHPREIVTGDFNRDGKLDVFFAGHGYDAVPFAGERNVLLLSTTGATYTNASAQLPNLPDFSHSATTGDINGDGYVDIFVGNLPAPQPAYFLIGGPGGVLTQSSAGLPPDILLPNGDTFLSDLLVDLDGDGFPELVLGTAGIVAPEKNIVLWNDGTGNYKTRPRSQLPDGFFGAGGNTDDIVSLDVNDDGRADLGLITTREGALQDIGFGFQILVNQGNGSFVDESIARLGAAASRNDGRWWTFLRVADINRDGWDDFYAVGYPQIGLSVPVFWINRGDGTFCAANNLTFFTDGGPAETMDIDGDDRLDFVVAGYNPDTRTFDYRSFLNRTPSTLRSLSVSDVTIAEGNSGTSQANVTVSLSSAATGAVGFDIYTDTGTASPWQDFQSNAAIDVAIPAGQTSTSFPVTVSGDTTVEADETFTVNVANVRHAKLLDGQGLGRIVNDDLASLSIADSGLSEGSGGLRTATFIVSLSRPMPTVVTFAIGTSNGTAVSPGDYIARNQTRQIDPGRTQVRFEVDVVADTQSEPTETFLVSISNAGGATIADGSATGTIVDDDSAALRGVRKRTR